VPGRCWRWLAAVGVTIRIKVKDAGRMQYSRVVEFGE
jgi:hypothetical protein